MPDIDLRVAFVVAFHSFVTLCRPLLAITVDPSSRLGDSADCVLLPISVGAVVTTVDAGMAFADWPTSDGHGMLAYPWLKSTGDKFLEHGHRLAGMLIGVMSLG